MGYNTCSLSQARLNPAWACPVLEALHGHLSNTLMCAFLSQSRMTFPPFCLWAEFVRSSIQLPTVVESGIHCSAASVFSEIHDPTFHATPRASDGRDERAQRLTLRDICYFIHAMVRFPLSDRIIDLVSHCASLLEWSPMTHSCFRHLRMKPFPSKTPAYCFPYSTAKSWEGCEGPLVFLTSWHTTRC